MFEVGLLKKVKIQCLSCNFSKEYSNEYVDIDEFNAIISTKTCPNCKSKFILKSGREECMNCGYFSEEITDSDSCKECMKKMMERL